jgi:hypothetical protein
MSREKWNSNSICPDVEADEVLFFFVDRHEVLAF